MKEPPGVVALLVRSGSGSGRLLGVMGRSYMLASDAAPLEDYGMEGPSWFAIHTRHQHEKVATHTLAHKGFEVFLPLYTTVRNWSDRTREVSLPLFPSYLFLRGGLDRQLSILTTPGVLSLVAFGGVPAVISDAEIDAVRQTLARSVRVEPSPFLKCGDWVRVKCGPLEGIEGILVRTKNQYRLVLSVELVQQSVAVEVDVWTVERVQKLERRWSARSFDSCPQAFAGGTQSLEVFGRGTQINREKEIPRTRSQEN